MPLFGHKIEEESVSAFGPSGQGVYFMGMGQGMGEVPLFGGPELCGEEMGSMGGMGLLEQAKMLELKREWHIHNAQQLQAQLIKEQHAIRECEEALKYYQFAWRGPPASLQIK